MKKILLLALTCISIALSLCFIPGCTTPPPQPTYEITFDISGGSGEIEGFDPQYKNAEITLPHTLPTKTGYTFDGWLYENELYLAGDLFTVPGNNVTFVAQYSQNRYTVKFDGISQSVLHGESATAPTDSTPSDTDEWDYTFIGWVLDSNCNGTADDGENIVTDFSNVTENTEYITKYSQYRILYEVEFDANSALGNAPAVDPLAKGEDFVFPQNTFTKHGYVFIGWQYNGTVYQPKDSIKMPADKITVIAQWQVFNPTFSQAEYSYDKVVGGELELPLNLGDLAPYYLDFNGDYLDRELFSYDAESGCLIVSESYMLNLTTGSYTLTLLTDGDGDPAVCTVIVDNSIKTEFDDVSTKLFTYGIDKGVSFDVDFGEATVTALKQGDTVIGDEYYTLDGNTFTISGEWLKKYYSDTTYSVFLSNYDKYDFTIQTNIVFYTDYDVTVIHDTKQSNVGHNSLYQYSDNVSITDGVEGMSGNVLKFTPNTTDVTYNCHSIYTIGSSTCSYNNWYKSPMNANKTYVVSFDYMPVDTTVGEFYFSTVPNDPFKVDLNLGEEHNGKVHHFVTVFDGSYLGNGIRVWAKFIGGGGYIFFDNFSVAQLDALPEISCENEEYILDGNDLTLSFNDNGYPFEIAIDGKLVEYGYNKDTNVLTIDGSELALLSIGEHKVNVITDLFTVSCSFRIVNLVGELVDVKASYSYENSKNIKLYGSFTEGVEIISVKQIDKAYDNGYAGGWDLSHCDPDIDYKNFATLTAGLNGEGVIEFDSEFGKLFWGDTQFTVEFSNGRQDTFTLTVTDVPFFTNYVDSNNIGKLNGNVTPHVLNNSGLNQGVYGIENGHSTYNTAGVAATEPSLFTTKFTNNITYDWFRVIGSEDKFYKIEIIYTVSNLADGAVFLEVWGPKGEDLSSSFFGDYDHISTVNANQDTVVYPFITDGKEHSLSTGWFTYDDVRRGCRIRIPQFNSDANAYVAINSIRIVSCDPFSNPLSALKAEYKTDETVTFTCIDEIVSATLNGSPITLDKQENTYSVKDDMKLGAYSIVIKTAKGTFRKSFNIVGNSVAELTETSKTVVYGQGDVKLAGNFDTSLTVTSVKRLGTINWDDTVAGLNAVTTDGSMKTSYVTVQEDGLVLAQALVDQCYATETYTVTFSNSKTVSFSLTSNVIYYNNFGETFVWVEGTDGQNKESCQDYTMVKRIVNNDGSAYLRYTPSNAKLSHALKANNRCFTFSVEGKNNWWWKYSFPSTGKIFITFDYTVTGAAEDIYTLFWVDAAETHHNIPLDRTKNTYYVELDISNLQAFAIGCSAYASASAGTYMDITNYAFGVVQS